MATDKDKMSISMYSASLFALINLPFTYTFVENTLNKGCALIDENASKIELYKNNCPTHLGRMVMTLIFYLVTYMSMDKVEDHTQRIKNSIYGTLIFYFVSSPSCFSLVRTIAKIFVSDDQIDMIISKDGCPSTLGVGLHAALFFIIIYYMMKL